MPFRKRFLAPLLTSALLAGPALLPAQQPSPPPKEEHKSDADRKPSTPSKLEEMLAEALKNNPDIRVAAAKVSQAEADLHRARLQVIQQVVTHYHALAVARVEVDELSKKVASMEQSNQLARGSVSQADYLEARHQLAVAKLKLEHLQSESITMLGKAPKEARLQGKLKAKEGELLAPILLEEALHEQKTAELNTVYTYLLRGAQSPVSTTDRRDKLRKALETPVKVSYKKQTLSAIFEDLQKQVPGLVIRDQVTATRDHPSEHTFVFEEPLPLTAFLQAIEDELSPQGGQNVFVVGNHPRFVVRDYGLLFTDRNLPGGALSPQDFLRQTVQPPAGGKK